jgi:hypothetical protein
MLATKWLSVGLMILAMSGTAAFADPKFEAPETATIGSEVTVTVTNPGNPRDFVTIVRKTEAEGRYDSYQYVEKGGALKLVMPPTPGDYELRLLTASSPYATLFKKALKLEPVTATVEFPAQVAAGSKFNVAWTGPNNDRDFIGLGDATQPYRSYMYTRDGKSLAFTAPDKPGTYAIRYFLGSGNKVIGEKPLTVGGVTGSVAAPATVGVGANFKIKWEGPNNPRDFITIVKAGTPERRYEAYAYTNAGNPVELRAPEQAGEYEVRYLTGQDNTTLASTKVAVTAATASLKAPNAAVAGSLFDVTWTGPNNQRDFINLVPKGAREGTSGSWEYTGNGSPAKMRAPLEPGDYELRYSLGQSYATLASAPIKITPGKEEPGQVRVKLSGTAPATNAVEIILDASGSMLQKIGGQRRIDIARQTLTKLTSSIIPAGTPFAMRVFGREVNSCQTDLFMALAPLNPATTSAQFAKLEAKNGAKTPIGASLAKVADDLSGAKGERLVVLLTDGEETCDGDPVAEIEKLQKAGAGVRVNIVGFAIDEPKLAVTFRQWAKSGNGAFFEANDAAGLNNALAQAMRPGFEVLDAKGAVVAEGIVEGDAVQVMPGSYSVRLKGQKTAPKSISVKAKEASLVSF